MIRNQIFNNPLIYDGFVLDPNSIDMQGWGDHPILTWAIERLHPKLVIEVGTWKGRSAIAMANRAKELNLECEIVCIDTWLGSPEHWNHQNQSYYSSLKFKHGRPTIYETFLSNVISNHCEDVITPLSLPSETAFFILEKVSARAQLIYIDAGHEYSSVLRDISLYWELLDDGGIMILDDYLGWQGVTRAVNEFAAEKGIQPFGEFGKAVLSKNSSLSISTKLIFS